MRWKLVLLNTLAIGLSVAALGCGASAPVVENARAEPPADLLQPKPKRVSYDTGQYVGVVTAVGANWLELGAGWEGVTGRKKQLDPTKPKRISAAGTTPGGDPDGGNRQTHRVSDLKVGDVVSSMTSITRDGEEWTVDIFIERRPGGRIPPQWGDPFVGSPHASHLRQQAEQDWEEKGIPLPKRYRSSGPWTKPPYPPVAPMPRPAKP